MFIEHVLCARHCAKQVLLRDTQPLSNPQIKVQANSAMPSQASCPFFPGSEATLLSPRPNLRSAGPPELQHSLFFWVLPPLQSWSVLFFSGVYCSSELCPLHTHPSVPGCGRRGALLSPAFLLLSSAGNSQSFYSGSKQTLMCSCT